MFLDYFTVTPIKQKVQKEAVLHFCYQLFRFASSESCFFFFFFSLKNWVWLLEYATRCQPFFTFSHHPIMGSNIDGFSVQYWWAFIIWIHFYQRAYSGLTISLYSPPFCVPRQWSEPMAWSWMGGASEWIIPLLNVPIPLHQESTWADLHSKISICVKS